MGTVSWNKNLKKNIIFSVPICSPCRLQLEAHEILGLISVNALFSFSQRYTEFFLVFYLKHTMFVWCVEESGWIDSLAVVRRRFGRCCRLQLMSRGSQIDVNLTLSTAAVTMVITSVVMVTPVIDVRLLVCESVSKTDVRRSIKLANFCGRCLLARENRPTKSFNHDTQSIISSATSYDISYLHEYTTAEYKSQYDTCIFFLHLMNENKLHRVTNK